MRFLYIDLLVIIAVVFFAWVIYKKWVNRIEQSKLIKTAYFSGGPLHGSEQKLAKLPDEIPYTYDKPKLTKLIEGAPPEPVQTWYDAIYDHQGDGVYEYQGSVPSTHPPRYDRS